LTLKELIRFIKKEAQQIRTKRHGRLLFGAVSSADTRCCVSKLTDTADTLISLAKYTVSQ